MKAYWLACFLIGGTSAAFAGDGGNDLATRFEKNIVAPSVKAVSESTPITSPPSERFGPHWYKRKYSIEDVEYDVRQTDSLVNPVVASIRFDCIVQVAEGDSAEQVANGPFTLSNAQAPSKCSVTYHVVNAKWMRQETVCDGKTIVSDGSGPGYFCSALLPKE